MDSIEYGFVALIDNEIVDGLHIENNKGEVLKFACDPRHIAKDMVDLDGNNVQNIIKMDPHDLMSKIAEHLGYATYKICGR